MKPEAVVYTSNTGTTAQYAQLLAQATGLPVCALSQAGKTLAPGSRILYLGWLMAGQVKGYKKAAKRYTVCAVCGVGMGTTGSQLEDVRRTNAVPAQTPVFTLQGGYDRARLHGVYKLMMTIMEKAAGKGLSEKENRTPEEDAMLDMLRHGGNRVSETNLSAVLGWYRGEA